MLCLWMTMSKDIFYFLIIIFLFKIITFLLSAFIMIWKKVIKLKQINRNNDNLNKMIRMKNHNMIHPW